MTFWPRMAFPGLIIQSRMRTASARCSKRFCLDDRRLRHHSDLLSRVGWQAGHPAAAGQVIVPEAVMRELQAAAAPPEVRPMAQQSSRLASDKTNSDDAGRRSVP